MLARSAIAPRNPPLLQRYGSQLNQILDRGQAELALSRGLELQKADALMRNIVEQSFDGILSINEDGRVRTANQAALRIFTCTPSDIIGQHFATLLPNVGEYRRLKGTPSDLAGDRLEGIARRHDGTDFPIELSLRQTIVADERLVIAIVRDITEAKAQERRLRHQALHDGLTGLPNRAFLKLRLDEALLHASLTGGPLALLLLDLDRFKEVNDTLGHQVGDLLLTHIARRLQGCVRASDTIARLGGDEFAILLPAVSDLVRAWSMARRVVKAIEQPFEVVPGLRIEVGISIGIGMFPEHADDESKLMQCADIAMYAAKRCNHVIETYDRTKDHNSIRQLTLTGALRQAIEGGELSFEFQPKLDLKTSAVCGVEALARWAHPTQGAIPPEEFITQAEQTGMIVPFTEWSFGTALAQLAAWQAAGMDLSLALNLSNRSLHDETLPHMVASLLEQWQVEPHRLTLELTETAVMLDPDGARKSLRQLRDLGLRFSIDDFGTGYSSLSQLQRLPLDELKIDKSFVTNMSDKRQDLVIVRSTIDLAHNLGLTVVAEGVETEQHLLALRELGCDHAQGFLIAEPMPMAELTTWLRDASWPVNPRPPERARSTRSGRRAAVSRS